MIESGNISPAMSVGHVEALQVLEVLGMPIDMLRTNSGATSIGC